MVFEVESIFTLAYLHMLSYFPQHYLLDSLVFLHSFIYNDTLLYINSRIDDWSPFFFSSLSILVPIWFDLVGCLNIW